MGLSALVIYCSASSVKRPHPDRFFYLATMALLVVRGALLPVTQVKPWDLLRRCRPSSAGFRFRGRLVRDLGGVQGLHAFSVGFPRIKTQVANKHPTLGDKMNPERVYGSYPLIGIIVV